MCLKNGKFFVYCLNHNTNIWKNKTHLAVDENVFEDCAFERINRFQDCVKWRTSHTVGDLKIENHNKVDSETNIKRVKRLTIELYYSKQNWIGLHCSVIIGCPNYLFYVFWFHGNKFFIRILFTWTRVGCPKVRTRFLLLEFWSELVLSRRLTTDNVKVRRRGLHLPTWNKQHFPTKTNTSRKLLM